MFGIKGPEPLISPQRPLPTPTCVCNMPTKPFLPPPHTLSPLTEFICISSATVTRRGGRLSSDPAARKLFNHNCLHTALHHTSRLPHLHHAAGSRTVAGEGCCKYPSVTSPLAYSAFFFFFNLHNGALFSALPDAHRGDAGSPVVLPQVGYL